MRGIGAPAATLALLGVFGTACGAASTSSTLDLTSLFEDERIAEARAEAPDLVAAAEHARRDAEASGDPDVAAEHATRARLLLDAAVVETERVRLDRARLEALAEAEAATSEALALEGERRDRARGERREAAAEIAREQMRAAFAAAEAREERRGRHRGPEVDRARRDAAIALRARAQLIIAAARALGASDDELAELPAEPDARDPSALVAAAEARHRAALALLGTKRATRDVSPELIASFHEAAAERELPIERRPEGLILEPESRHASAVGDLARAFPHGAVLIRGRGARRFAEAARRGLDADRFVIEEGREPLVVVFPEYGAR